MRTLRNQVTVNFMGESRERIRTSNPTPRLGNGRAPRKHAATRVPLGQLLEALQRPLLSAAHPAAAVPHVRQRRPAVRSGREEEHRHAAARRDAHRLGRRIPRVAHAAGGAHRVLVEVPRRAAGVCARRRGVHASCTASGGALSRTTIVALSHTIACCMSIGCSLYHLLLEAPEGFRKRSSRPKAATKELHSRLNSAKDEPPPLTLASRLAIAARLAQGNRVSPPGVVRVWHARWCARCMHMHMHMRGRHGRCRRLLGQRTLSRSSTREGWRRGPGDQRPCRGEGFAPGLRTYTMRDLNLMVWLHS